MAFNREKTLANAQKHLRKGNVDRALKEYERMIDEGAADTRDKLKVADLYIKVNRFDDALKTYREVAAAYAREDFYEKAAAVHKQALRVAPNDPQLHADLGDAYYRLGRLKDAIRVYHKAQKIYKAAGDAINQTLLLERMVEIDPEDVGLRIQLAERFEKEGNREESIALFTQAAAQLKDEGRLDEWVQVSERMVFLQPKLVELRKEIVRAYLSRGDEKHALKHLQFCFREHPQDLETLELLGSTFHRLGNDQKALLVYKELASLYERLGQPARAEDAWRSILNIDPSDPDAKAALGQNEPEPEPEVEFLDIEPDEPDDDALAGVEFLDDDDDDGFEPFDPTAPPAGGQFDDFAQDAVSGFDADSAVLSSLPEYPTAPHQPHAAAEAPIIEVEVELEPADAGDEIEFQGAGQIRQFLTESDVFLKYGLLDRAEEVITKVLQLEPENLGGHDQMRKLLLRMGDKRGAASRLVEMARLTIATPHRAGGFLEDALELVDEDTVAALAESAGIPYPLDSELGEGIIEEISEGIEEISAPLGAPDAEVGAHTIDFIDDVDALLDEPAAAQSTDDVMLDMEGVEDDSEAAVDADDLMLGMDSEPDEDAGMVEATDGSSDEPVYELPEQVEQVEDALEEEEEEEEEEEILDADDLVEEVYEVDDIAEEIIEADDLIEEVHEASDAAEQVYDAIEADDEEHEGELAADVSTGDLDLDDDEVEDVEDVEDVDFPMDDVEMDDIQMDVAVDDLIADFDDLDDAAFDEVEDLEDLSLDGADVVDLNVDGVDFDVDQLAALDAPAGGDFDLDFSAEDADAMFDELFGGDDDSDVVPDSDDSVSEIEFYIGQGMFEEAEEALEDLESNDPTNPAIAVLRARLAGNGDGNAGGFGQASLSGKYAGPMTNPSIELPDELDDVNNSNLELGKTYRDMGLFNEAIDEFRQALDDPDAAPAATYFIALCHLALGDSTSAHESLEQLSSDETIPANWRDMATEKLQEFSP